MDPTPLSQIASWSGAEFLAGDRDLLVTGVSHDTRTLQPGELYVALRGEAFDGHQFIHDALKKGAVGVLCDGTLPQDLPASFGILRVADSLEGLTLLARAWRQELALLAIVLTGSNGKTSTKDFLTTILSRYLQVTSTQGNFNNHIGVPLSILKASRSDRVAVWEIGMNHRGEIAPLAALTQPTIGIITNIGTAHIGFLGSREAIAEEKGELLTSLPAEGVAILPAADDFCESLAAKTKARVLRVGIGLGELQAHSLVSMEKGTEFQISYQGRSLSAFLPVIGTHMVQNALLALAASLECSVSLEEGIAALATVQPSNSRLKLHELAGVILVDDAYNASPDSTEAALSAIQDLKAKRRIALLGYMGELGAYALQGYQRVGLKAAASLDILIVVSEEALPLANAAREAGMKEVHHLASNEAAAALVLSLLRPEDLLLVKGSKSTHLNEVVEQLKNSLPQQELLHRGQIRVCGS